MTRKGKSSTALSGKRIWLIIGGLGGVVAIIGLVVSFAGLLQDRAAIRSEDVAQATMIAIEKAQLTVQGEIATFQASDVRAGPTATAMAKRVAQLMSTQEALEAERRTVEATLAAVVPQATISTTPSPPSMRVLSQVSGVSAELVEFSRFENTVTIKVRFINSSEEDQSLSVTFGSYLLNEATHKKYEVTEQSNRHTAVVPAGGSLEVWAKYGLPEGEKPEYITVILEHGILFEHLEVP